MVVFCVSVCFVSFLLRRFSACSVCRLVSFSAPRNKRGPRPPAPTPPAFLLARLAPLSSLSQCLVRCPPFLSSPSLPVLGVLPLRTALFAGERSPKNASCRGGGHVVREGPGRRPIRAKAARAGWLFALKPPTWLHRTSHPGVLLPRRLQATTDGRGLGGAHGATFFDHARHRQLRRSRGTAGRPQLAGRL